MKLFTFSAWVAIAMHDWYIIAFYNAISFATFCKFDFNTSLTPVQSCLKELLLYLQKKTYQTYTNKM